MKHKSNQKNTRTRWFAVMVGVALAWGMIGTSSATQTYAGTATEGEQLELTVKLGATPTGWAVRYKYKTVDDSALAGDDYTAVTESTVTFNSGIREQKLYFETAEDGVAEETEVFKVKFYEQETNGLIYGATGWVSTTLQIYGMPKTFNRKAQITDDD